MIYITIAVFALGFALVALATAGARGAFDHNRRLDDVLYATTKIGFVIYIIAGLTTALLWLSS
jgi:hypothetical protein